MIEKTNKLVKAISSHFYKLEIQGLLISVNALTISINTRIPNSNLWIQRRGSGKSEFLRILAESNSDRFIVLPEKLYETTILEFDQEYFNDKVWIHDDFIVAIHGLTTKQRHQLMGLFVELLSKGEYVRRDRSGEYKVKGRISCIFPIAQENYSRYGKELFYQTLVPERLVPVGFDFTAEDMRKAGILKLEKEYNTFRKDIKLKLPFSDEKVSVKLPKEFFEEINNLSMRLQLLCGLSNTRGVEYVSNWLKAHALLNDREEVVKEDLEIFKLILPAHQEPRESLESEIRRFIFNKLLEQEGVSSSEIYKSFSDYDKRVIRRVLQNIKRDCPNKRGQKDEIIFYI